MISIMSLSLVNCSYKETSDDLSFVWLFWKLKVIQIEFVKNCFNFCSKCWGINLHKSWFGQVCALIVIPGWSRLHDISHWSDFCCSLFTVSFQTRKPSQTFRLTNSVVSTGVVGFVSIGIVGFGVRWGRAVGFWLCVETGFVSGSLKIIFKKFFSQC